MKKTKVTDEQICTAVISCKSVEDAADYLHVSESTIYKRMQTEKCRMIYKDLNFKILQAATEKIRTTMLSAIQIVYDIADNEENSPQIRLNACDILLRHALKLSSHDFANEEHERKMNETTNRIAEDLLYR